MFNLLIQHKVIAGVGIVLILGAVWYGLSASSAPPPILQTEAKNPAEQQLVATLLTLRAVTLSGTIFSDPVFMSLKDFSTTIQSEPAGRPNPFAPLSPVLSAPQDSRQAQLFSPPAR